MVGLRWDTVKRIDSTALVARLVPIDLTGVRVIAIDEFAIQRGHHSATVVDPATKQVLGVGRGRAREDVRPFFALLGPVATHQRGTRSPPPLPPSCTRVHRLSKSANLLRARGPIPRPSASGAITSSWALRVRPSWGPGLRGRSGRKAQGRSKPLAPRSVHQPPAATRPPGADCPDSGPRQPAAPSA